MARDALGLIEIQFNGSKGKAAGSGRSSMTARPRPRGYNLNLEDTLALKNRLHAEVEQYEFFSALVAEEISQQMEELDLDVQIQDKNEPEQLQFEGN
mgnify:CR=1 FL=1